MPDFFFPMLFCDPTFPENEIECGPFAMLRRRWGVTIFDVYTLTANHKMHLPAELMHIFLGRCNGEIRVRGYETSKEASTALIPIRIGLYAMGVSPFIYPLIMSHSLNEIAGINNRDSGADFRMKELPDELKTQVSKATGTVEVWPLELSLSCIVLESQIKVSAETFTAGCEFAAKWAELEKRTPSLKAVRDAAAAAPKLSNLDQSLLHIWCAIESLFPNVTQEVSFRLALYLAELIGPRNNRMTVYKNAKNGYNLRSKIAHGAKQKIELDDWRGGWDLLMGAINAIVQRGGMPNEEELIRLLFDSTQNA